MRILIILFCLFNFSNAFSKPVYKTCGKKDLDQAYKAVISIVAIEDVNTVWPKYKRCIDGSVAEAYDESISKLLDTKWEQVVHSPLLKNDVVLEGLHQGISETWEYNLSKRVLFNSKNNCTPDAKKLCEWIIKSDPSEQKK